MRWLLLLAGAALASWPLVGPTGTGAAVEPATYLRDAPLRPAVVRSDPQALARVAADVLRWRAAHRAEAGPALLGTVDPEPTLSWIVKTAAEDPGKLADSAWLATQLRFVAWSPDVAAAASRKIQLAPDQIRRTSYLAWRMDGSPVKDAAHPHALYAVPDDEAGLTPEEAASRTDLLRLRYTRREVLDGVYEPGGAAAGRAKPLGWLSRAQVHEALMQGTVVLRFPDGSERTLNVYRNNGRTWDPAKATDPDSQDRLWYFREVDGLRGYGTEDKVRIEPQVTVAGDVANLGLGALVAMRWTVAGQDHLQLAILADTGGAFAPNLFQVDWLVGIYGDRAEFNRDAAAIPDRVEAGFLVLNTP